MLLLVQNQQASAPHSANNSLFNSIHKHEINTIVRQEMFSVHGNIYIKNIFVEIYIKYKCKNPDRCVFTLLMSKFCGLRSLCRTFRLWQNANPLNNWYLKGSMNSLRQSQSRRNKCKYLENKSYRNDLTTSRSISPFRLSKYFLRSWSQCSNTKVSFLSLCSTS